MKIKKILPAFMLIILNTFIARASYFPRNIDNAFLWLFHYLPEGLRSQDMVAIMYFKFLLFIFVFAVVFEALKKALHSKNSRVDGAVAFVISLGSVIFMQDIWVLWIIQTYSIVVIIALLLMPLVLLYLFGKWVFPNVSLKNHWARGGVFILAAIAIGMFASWISASSSHPNMQFLGNFLSVVAFIFMFIGLIILVFASVDTFRGAGGGGSGSSGSSRSGGGSSPSSSGQPQTPAAGDWTPRDIQNRINDMSHMFGQIEQLSPQYEQSLRDMCHRNHDNNAAGHGIDNLALNGLEVAVQLANQQARQLGTWMTRIRQLQNEIFSMRSFGQIGRRTNRQYATLVNRILRAAANATAITAQANRSYAAGDEMP